MSGVQHYSPHRSCRDGKSDCCSVALDLCMPATPNAASLQSVSVRQLCSSTLLQFLLDYPLGEKRFREHVNFLAANLAYEHESGRLAAIDLLSVLASKLPADMLAAYAPTFFMPLVRCMVGDRSAACRKEAGQALQQLLKVSA